VPHAPGPNETRGGRGMSTEPNKEVARRYYEWVLNDGEVEALDEMAVPDYQEHDPLPGQGTGLQGLKDRVTMLKSGLDSRFTIEDLIAEGDKVVVRWTNSGTNVGEFLGMPPTGKGFTIAGIDIHRLEDGKMAEHWHVVDNFSMLLQLGLIPPPGGGGE
jgi:steroid delta-isomerase-like uncharacterized protein